MSGRFLCRCRANRAGFTLTEILVTMVILSLGFLGLSAMTITTIQSLSFSNHLTTATMLTQEKLEQIKNTSYANVITGQENYDTIPNYPDFRRVVTVVNGALNTKNVTVTTYWRSAKGNNVHQVAIKTIISG
jgi:type IV pilus assembly protein PilV